MRRANDVVLTKNQILETTTHRTEGRKGTAQLSASQSRARGHNACDCRLVVSPRRLAAYGTRRHGCHYFNEDRGDLRDQKPHTSRSHCRNELECGIALFTSPCRLHRKCQREFHAVAHSGTMANVQGTEKWKPPRTSERRWRVGHQQRDRQLRMLPPSSDRACTLAR